MAVWKQETYVNGVLTYEPKYLSDGALARRFAQMLFLKQGDENENIVLDTVEYDDMFNVLVYKAKRKTKDKTIVHIYRNVEKEV